MLQTVFSYLNRKGWIPKFHSREEKRMKILSILNRGERSGRRIQQSMHQCGYRIRTVAFYAIASGMEDDDLIEGWYTSKVVHGYKILERCYRITNKGRNVLEGTRSEVAK